MNSKKLREMEYKKCLGLLAELTGLDVATEERIFKYLQSMGIKGFFLHLDLFDLPQEILEKLKGIKSVIEVLEIERGQA